ncbi:ORC-CDC6 family AAA ATPase [Burkholderia sp. MSMB1826]|uniref:ORC-CDC6 family AAA ATPase n=1 Tax=Burkholderia sp. MSMB1826 TaxID=1637875 RepID=UPI0009EBE3ED|nr:hypothetical protein [Burkholderia sp. MSMB1826]
MAYRANPFLERMSERTSDQEFVRLFSPRILERLHEDAFEGAVHLFTSPPGGGKTTLLRAFTPMALRAFWNARAVQETSESYQRLMARQVLHETDGPQLLGVLLSCASGYADLPAGASMAQAGLFRALLDCRVVLRTLRSLASLLGYTSTDQLAELRLEYDEAGRDLTWIPTDPSALEVVKWAEERERYVYEKLDSLGDMASDFPAHVRFESVLWLQCVRFVHEGRPVAPKRLLMIDDLQSLRRRQRKLLLEEFVELRTAVPIWLAERSIALGDELLSQGAREGRDVRHYPLEEMWAGNRGGHQFATFAQSILDRRLDVQRVIPAGAFSQYLEDQLAADEIKGAFAVARENFSKSVNPIKNDIRYAEWLSHAELSQKGETYDALLDLYVTRIMIARVEARRQLTLDLAPLPAVEVEDSDSKVLGAAEVFCHEELDVPLYYGIDRLCSLATGNVEELLGIAANLYEGMRAKQVLRKQLDPRLSPAEQERRIKEVAKRKHDFIPKNHTEGTRAQNLLDAIGQYCYEKTFQLNAPYAPGVTGVRLSQWELNKIRPGAGNVSDLYALLGRVLSECVAENLLTTRDSAASTNREGGTVFYLNRTLCAYYELPLQYGGWQDVTVDVLVGWLDRGPTAAKRRSLEVLR